MPCGWSGSKTPELPICPGFQNSSCLLCCLDTIVEHDWLTYKCTLLPCLILLPPLQFLVKSANFISFQLEEQIEQHCIELQQEQNERNYFMNESNRVMTFWEITKQEVSNRRAQILNCQRILHEKKKEHEAQLQVRR